MYGNGITEGDFVTREELEEAKREMMLHDDGTTTRVERTSAGQMVTCTIPVGEGAIRSIRDSISGMIEAPEDKTYILDISTHFAGSIDEISTKGVGGTANISVTVDNTSVSFTTPPTFSTTLSTFAASTGTSKKFTEGDKLSLILSSTSSGEDFAFTLAMTRDIG